MPNFIQSTVIQKTYLNENVIELRLAKPNGFSFVAGQFIQLVVSEVELLATSPATSLIRRSYSISSTPNDPYIELCIKLLPDGIGIGSKYIAAIAVDDAVAFLGPHGRFTTTGVTAPLSCIATGVGLAPIMGLIVDELKNKKNTQPIELIFGVRTESDIFWLERLETLARDYPNFSYRLTLSQPTDTWQSHRGRVTAHLDHHTSGSKFYLCGSQEMVKDVKTLLTKKNVPVGDIHFEIF